MRAKNKKEAIVKTHFFRQSVFESRQHPCGGCLTFRNNTKGLQSINEPRRMNYRILSEHLHDLYMTSSTLFSPTSFFILENGGMKCEATLFYTWSNKTVHTFTVFTVTEASRQPTSCRSGAAATAE